MNEFLSNSSTLINPDSVYDQEKFINILQIILQTKTQKELSEQTGLNNATISRMLNGARSGRPYKSTIDKIAKAIDNPELIKELFGFFCEDSHYIEIRGFSCKAFGLEKDVYDYYLIATHKSLDTPLLINESVGLINSDKSGEKYKNSLSFVLKKIKERLL